MNLRKLCTAVLSAAGTLLLASTSFASPSSPQILAVGSSGIFTSMGIAAVNGDPQTGASTICGSNFWSASGSSGLAYAVDGRTGKSIPNEGGSIWVAWDADPPNVVCAYLSVDSIVGQRLFLGQGAAGNATLTVTAAAKSTAGANAVSFVLDTATTGLPASVWNVLTDSGAMDQHFNVALTDIRPEDGQYAYTRAACNRANQYDVSCFGYGPLGGVGTAILSSYTATSAQVVAYSISGTDPFTGLTVPSFQTIPIGATPILLFYNTTNTTDGLGAYLPTNITDSTAAMIWSGQFGLVDQLVGRQTGSTKTLHVVQREPVSGTYNTFEFQMIHTRDSYGGAWSQEFGFGPTPSCAGFTLGSPKYTPPVEPGDLGCANPMDVAGAMGTTYGGRRTRGIGTGELVGAVNSSNNPDSIGYAFWGLGTFGGKTNTKYMTVNGAEPLFANYQTNNGAPPSCSGYFNAAPAFGCTGAFSPISNVTFANLTNGSYRVWSTIRAVIYSSYTPPATGPSVQTLILGAQDQAHVNVPDFVPTVYCSSGSSGNCTGGTTTGMPVFRSHYPISGTNPNNGVISPSSEAGGDMAGRAFYNVQESEFYSLTGNYLYTFIE